MGRPRRFVVALSIVLLAMFVGGTSVHGQMSLPPTSFEDVVSKAKAANTPILLEIYAPWCPYCQRMQETVYADSTVRSYLSSNFTYARLNRDKEKGMHQYDGQTFTTQELAAAFGARGVPTTVFLTSDGTPIASQPGFIKRPTFLTMIRYVGSGAYRKTSFRSFANENAE